LDTTASIRREKGSLTLDQVGGKRSAVKKQVGDTFKVGRKGNRARQREGRGGEGRLPGWCQRGGGAVHGKRGKGVASHCYVSEDSEIVSLNLKKKALRGRIRNLKEQERQSTCAGSSGYNGHLQVL